MEQHFGKYRAIVTETNDPQQQGRIKVKCPKILGEFESDWCLPSVPIAGPNCGWITLPQPNDMVWLEFEEGDPEKPIYSGFLWGSGEAPTADNQVSIFIDVHGNKISTSVNGIEFISKDGDKLVLSNSHIELISKDGDKMVLGNSNINMNTTGDVNIKCVSVRVD